MDNNWAAVHLETIRTLMERSALYRRALAPISTLVGLIGIFAAIAGWAFQMEQKIPFAVYWMTVGVVAIVGALVLVRRQAVKQGENFWSPPTRRVAQAMFPALLIGFVLSCQMVKIDWSNHDSHMSGTENDSSLMLVVVWTILYGLALHAAGFFMPRGIRLFGWAFVLVGLALVTLASYAFRYLDFSPHWFMGIIFGVSHLAYGIYLYFTEPRKLTA